jgi:hypothetical protein
MHRFGRIEGFAVVAAGAVMALSGCSSSGTVGAAGSPPPAGAGADTGTGMPQSCKPTPDNYQCGIYNGTWTGTTDGTSVTLAVAKDTAELKTPHDCPGSFNGQLLLLTCNDGDKDRQTGSATLSSDHKTLTVSWDDGITDTLTKG